MGSQREHIAHDVRALLSSVVNACVQDGDVMKRQSAGVERIGVLAAQHRATCLDDRVRLMQWTASAARRKTDTTR